ncbi:hypothetical protein PsorP6_003597 [Peronosclerospora sorghi]|uniref:Uncharacterized protein n=1 Tax=Peronosclerospora sorghi TaxID=230839 RepID=A0ACC0VS62_9STRA|nr:hypothetical protein PsorP6_003597 [Peronosclerospora sorghi]
MVKLEKDGSTDVEKNMQQRSLKAQEIKLARYKLLLEIRRSLLSSHQDTMKLRNDNSSRFGKLIEIQCNPHGKISGAQILRAKDAHGIPELSIHLCNDAKEFDNDENMYRDNRIPLGNLKFAMENESYVIVDDDAANRMSSKRRYLM